MDIEELKKLNSLTVELKKHGMPADEAFKQAESLIRAKEDVGPVVMEHAAPSQDFMLEKKFSLMLDMNNKKFQEAIDVLSKMISSVSQELASVRGELAEARQVLKQKKDLPVQKEKQEALPKQESHPRQGSFQPSDVSIEKMFYFGKK
ncbi:hypothetical protein HY490_03955 [Candidatus Woesearchaeota archaeon]|nr:hypothetical protein [Candidatus Woesearchaeota archaeon]